MEEKQLDLNDALDCVDFLYGLTRNLRLNAQEHEACSAARAKILGEISDLKEKMDEFYKETVGLKSQLENSTTH